VPTSNFETMDRLVPNSRLGKYLEQHVPGFSGPLSLEKFPGGQSNPTYLLTAASGQYVLRGKPPGELLASAHAIDREHRVLQALSDTNVPVARVYHLCEDEAVFGSMFYIMSYEAGRIFWNPALSEVPTEQRYLFLEEQITVLAALHNVDIDAVGLADYGRAGNYYQRQISRWSKQYRAAETESFPAMEILMQWLPENIPVDAGSVSLLHGDYRLDNLIYHPTEARIVAVLDWELSTLGDPLADLAYLCMCLRLPKISTLQGLAGENLSELGIPDEKELVAMYCKLRGLDRIDHWPFYLAFSYFRLASICQGVYARAQAGNASDSTAATRDNATPALANMAIKLLEEGSDL
jgi:aminoglycoside phosphotransferase (APT) family kinase protein